MDLIKRPKQVQRAEKGYLDEKKYQDYAESQFKTIYDKTDEIIKNMDTGSSGGLLTDSVIGWNGDTIPEGYEEIEIKNSLNVEDLSSEVTNINTSATSKSVKAYKYGRILYLNLNFERSGNWTSGNVLCKLSEKIMPMNSMFFTGCGGANSIKNFNINTTTGEVKILGDMTNTNWLSAQTLYLCKETTD